MRFLEDCVLLNRKETEYNAGMKHNDPNKAFATGKDKWAATLKPSLTLYTSPGVCPACDRWKAFERSRIIGVQFGELVDTSGQFPQWPAFVLEKYGKRVVMTGYQSAEVIVKTLDGLK